MHESIREYLKASKRDDLEGIRGERNLATFCLAMLHFHLLIFGFATETFRVSTLWDSNAMHIERQFNRQGIHEFQVSLARLRVIYKARCHTMTQFWSDVYV